MVGGREEQRGDSGRSGERQRGGKGREIKAIAREGRERMFKVEFKERDWERKRETLPQVLPLELG